ncbi:MAG TPA: FAD binding domain-containing protein [Candidatus Limnocylindrales bacterium]|nr:FAD binding domain-containing protein [Candidatus Limnocylindrales bacterium]
MYIRPNSLQDALNVLADSRATILAGGTDVFPTLGDRPLSGPVLDISGLAEIRGIQSTAEHVVFGARTTWSEVLAASLPPGFDGLKAAAREIGSVQIQNAATIAGNLCNASPAADGVAALLALDAEVVLSSRHASRTMPLAEFILGNRKTARRPDELLTSLRVPRRIENAASIFLKLGARRYLVISIVMVAANLVVDSAGNIREALVCVGSCSAVALRLAELERALVGQAAVPGLAKAVRPEQLTRLSPIDDVRATAEYRRDAALTLVGRALEACTQKAVAA